MTPHGWGHTALPILQTCSTRGLWRYQFGEDYVILILFIKSELPEIECRSTQEHDLEEHFILVN